MTDPDLYLDPDICPLCGFRPRNLRPGDAVRVVRSLPGRWREALTHALSGEDRDRLLRQSLGNGPSALAQATLVTEALRSAADQLDQLLTGDHPSLELGVPPGPADSGNPPDAESVFSAVADEALRLSAGAERFQGHDWLRTGFRAGREVTALAVLRRAVHEGIHRLHRTTRGLIRLRAAEAANASPAPRACCPAA